MSMNKCLVTGAAGFIGSHVAEQLVKKGYNVIGIDNMSGGYIENVPQGVDFIDLDILNIVEINKLFEKESFDYVYHLAAYAAEGLSHFIKRFNYNNNIIGSVNIINACVNTNVKCLIFTSSMAVYGAAQVPMVESMIPQPEDSYGIAKYAIEQELKISHDMFGLDYIIFRPHNVVGIRQNIWDKYRNVVGIFMNQVMSGRHMTIFGDGEQKRAFSCIDDVAPVIADSINYTDAYNEVFNIGGDIPYTINQLAELIAEAMNVVCKVNHLPPRCEVKNAYSSHDKLKEVFGRDYKSPKALGVILPELVKWVNSVGFKQVKEFKNIEIEKNLYEAWKKNV